MEEYEIGILGLSEIKDIGKRTKELGRKYRVYNSGVIQREKAKERVELVLKDDLCKKVIDYKFIYSKLIYIKLKLEKMINFIQIYARVEGTNETEIDVFNEYLQ